MSLTSEGQVDCLGEIPHVRAHRHPGDWVTVEVLLGLNSCLRTPNPLRAATKLSSTNEELLNGAQGVSKWEHQESSMPSYRVGT